MKKKSHFSIILFLLVFLFCFVFASCVKANFEQERTEIVFGTVCSINLYDKGTSFLYDECFLRLRDLENKLSSKIDSSEISKINQAAGIQEVFVSDDTFFLLENAKNIAALTDGAFDPTIGPLVELWNVQAEKPAIPQIEEIQKAKAKVDYTKLILNAKRNGVFLAEKGMKIDVGGIAKGYATDKLVEYLASQNIEKALINLGGNIYVLGEKSESQKNWSIGIKNPRQDEIMEMPADNAIVGENRSVGESRAVGETRNVGGNGNESENPAASTRRISSIVGVVEVCDASVVTSGDYERFFEKDGVRYHHIIDSKTGYPSNNDVMSFSIIAKNSMIADALSTACFVLGQQKGMELLERIEVAGVCVTKEKGMELLERIEVAGVCVTKDKRIYTTSTIKDAFLLVESSYSMAE